MQKYIKNYLNATGLLPHEINCSVCGSNESIDIHHIQHRQKNNPELDKYENLIALCRLCHTKAHSDKKFNESLKIIVNNR